MSTDDWQTAVILVLTINVAILFWLVRPRQK